MPEKNLPFFEMFALYTPDACPGCPGEGVARHRCSDGRKARTIEVQLLCPAASADPALLARLSGEVAQAYGLTGVVFQPACPQPAEDAPIPPPDDSDGRPRLLMRISRRSQRLWWKLRLLPKRLLPSQNRPRP